MLEQFQSLNNPALAAKLNAMVKAIVQSEIRQAGLFTSRLGSLNGSVYGVSEPLLTPRIPRPPSGSSGTAARLYEVQSTTVGDGLYTCYLQNIDATYWAGTAGNTRFVDVDAEEVTILNLLEGQVAADYTRGLARYDKIWGWSRSDDENNTIVVGMPIVPQARLFKTTEAATANEQITCNAILSDGTEAASEDDILYGVELYADVSHGTALNAATPRLVDDDYVLAQHIRGKWWITTKFQATDDCACN